MPNIFDQFDQPEQAGMAPANVFDQFDAPMQAEQVIQPPSNQIAPPIDLKGAIQDRLKQRSNLMEDVGGLEALGKFATGIVAEPIAGIAGLGGMAFGQTPQEATETIESVRGALTYEPRTQEGKQVVQSIGEKLQPIGEAIDYIPKAIGDYAMELTGSPEIATAAYSTPYAVVELLGLKGLNKLKKGTQLIDDAGRPTKALRTVLDKKGLDFDNLTPEARSAIPSVADQKFLAGATTKGSAEKALVSQIKSGGRDNALAPLMVIGDKVTSDTAALKAIKQGFGENYVQMVKTTSPATKAKMRNMLNITRRISKDASLETKIRATDVAGGSLNSRIKFIRSKADSARKELDNIASTKLKGAAIDTDRVANKLGGVLDDLDIKVTSAKGKPSLDFSGSAIAKDPSSQKAIRSAVDLLSYGGKPDALRAHKLKRQLDSLIDFSKKGPQGLGKEGKNALKAIRHELNQVVREINPQYAKVNDTMHAAIDTIEGLDKATGTVSLTSPNSATGLGTSLRKLTSNYASRESLMTALENLDDTITKFGGKFDDNLTDLVSFSNALDDRFGTTAKTSFAGQIEQATKRAVGQGATSATRDAIAEAAAHGVNKLRGVNDFNAFEAMDALLKRK